MRNNRKKISKIILNILTIALTLSACYFFYRAYMEHKPFQNEKIKEEALQDTIAPKDQIPDDPLNRNIDFDSLKSINPDVIAWIYAPQIGVDAPILKGKTDTYYLHHNFQKQYSILGSIFVYPDYSEKLDNPHICIFGHNMISGQMFGQLKKYYDESFQKQNPYMYIYTPERSKKLQVSCVKRVHKTDAIYQNDWTDGTNLQSFTLSTCVGSRMRNYRTTVTAHVIKEKIKLTK